MSKIWNVDGKWELLSVINGLRICGISGRLFTEPKIFFNLPEVKERLIRTKQQRTKYNKHSIS